MTSKIKKNNDVFIVSLVITVAVVLWGVVSPKSFETAANSAFGYLTGSFGWLYLISVTLFVFFCIWVALSKYGKIRLGADDSTPEFSTLSWFSMLFSAGMGIGLVFWGVAEPLYHYASPIAGIEKGTAEAANFAIRKSFLHWGIHPWACYGVLALALAYMQFRKGKPGLISCIFIPLLGEEIVKGWVGKTIDILAIFATIAGVATSMGLGAMQISAGLNYVYGIPNNVALKVIIIVVVTVAFIASAISGLNKGIKYLSNFNVSVAAILMIICFIAGPTVLILSTFSQGLGLYLDRILVDSLRLNPYAEGGAKDWFGWWTIFYWAWWIAWAPFVGVFIARISKGRTIRQFIVGVIFAPSLASFIWFSIFGAMGINLGLETATLAIKDTSTAFFVVMAQYPLGTLLSLTAVVLLCSFFVTSADSATFVLGMLSSHGDLEPPVARKVIWGCVQTGLALVLLLATANGLKMLQTASIVAAFPFAFIMLAAMVSMVKALKSENV